MIGTAASPTIAARLAALAEGESRWSITFLDSQGAATERWSAPELAARTASIAGFLERETAPGAPVLLVFQPCVAFLAAFLACQWCGRLAVPINPPRRHRLIQRLQAVAIDSGAALALTGGGVAEHSALWRAESPELARLGWRDVGAIPGDGPPAPLRDVDPATTSFLQYTSGSTAAPKGVEVSHANLMADMARMEQAWGLSPASVMVTWLPAFHDLGLIFGLLQPIFSGCPVAQMAPNSFLQRPALWLEAITRFRGTHTAAPNFAYDLCCRRIPAEQRAGLDLSSLVMAMNAAEPIDPEVMDRFVAMFGPQGFGRETFAPAYGLAESTLAVTASPVGAAPLRFDLDPAALEAGRIAPALDGARRRVIAGCGTPLPDAPIAIVDPATGRRQPPDRVGEIWVGGPTIARGYWRRPQESAASFAVRIVGEEGPGFLRTGDLGAMIGSELCVTGRIKDLIILSGVNHYPQDIERVAQAAHPALRAGGGAAFGVAAETGGEQVVLVQELERAQRRVDPEPVFSAIGAAVWRTLELNLSRIVLVEPGAVLRTSSGKIQRGANRAAWRSGALPTIAEWVAPSARRREAAPASPVEAMDAADAAEIRSWLRAWLAKRLDLPLAALADHRGVGELGLTSVDAVALAAALGGFCRRDLPQSFAFEHPTVAAMVAFLCRTPTAQMVAKAAPATPMRASPPGGDDLEEILAMIEGGVGGRC